MYVYMNLTLYNSCHVYAWKPWKSFIQSFIQSFSVLAFLLRYHLFCYSFSSALVLFISASVPIISGRLNQLRFSSSAQVLFISGRLHQPRSSSSAPVLFFTKSKTGHELLKEMIWSPPHFSFSSILHSILLHFLLFLLPPHSFLSYFLLSSLPAFILVFIFLFLIRCNTKFITQKFNVHYHTLT